MKVFNVVDPESAKYLHKSNYEKIYNDIVGEIVRIVPIVKAFIVNTKTKGIGAEVGSIFVELDTLEDSEKLIQSLLGKNYDKREIKIVCVPEEAYVTYYLSLFAKDALHK